MAELLASDSEPFQKSKYGESKLDCEAAAVKFDAVRVGGGDGEGDEMDRSSCSYM